MDGHTYIHSFEARMHIDELRKGKAKESRRDSIKSTERGQFFSSSACVDVGGWMGWEERSWDLTHLGPRSATSLYPVPSAQIA